MSLAAARKASKEVSIEFLNMEKVFHSRRKCWDQREESLSSSWDMGEIWDGSGKLRTNRNLGPKRDLIGLNICIPQSFWKQWLVTLEYENWQLQYWAVSADLLDYCDSTYASWMATNNSSLVMDWKSKQQAASFHSIDTHPPNRSPELQRLGSCFGTPKNMEANQWCKATK